ncbi:MAG TPA: glycosyltransferase [Tepidisphaeraceae bacterium]|jgi:GT2 family glycosyltransferase|nr:glycosyltransferase [Tepidisphaeraceae bacterium]
MKLSYVIVTRNRRDTLLRTLELLEQNTHLPRSSWEVFVIDNASDDGTADAVSRAYRDTTVIRLAENEGVPARNHALRPSRGRYVVFLDDDSFPLDDAIPRSLAYLSRHPKTAALVARVMLPNGNAEAPAMPAITLGGASVMRRSVLEEVGGFAPEFFRQAEEYDLSFRIWNAGYRIERFEDILFGHDKVAGGRSSALTRRMDLRNNLILTERYLPRPMRRVYRHDWLRRYGALGLHEGHHLALNTAVKEAHVWARREASVGRRLLHEATLEAVFQWNAQAKAIADWSRANQIRRVAIADVSKNIYATYRGCREAGLEIGAVLESSPAFAGSTYRHLSIIPDAQAGNLAFDGIVLSTVNPAQVDSRAQALAAWYNKPILRLWEPKYLDAGSHNSPKPHPDPVAADPAFAPLAPPKRPAA